MRHSSSLALVLQMFVDKLSFSTNILRMVVMLISIHYEYTEDYEVQTNYKNRS